MRTSCLLSSPSMTKGSVSRITINFIHVETQNKSKSVTSCGARHETNLVKQVLPFCITSHVVPAGIFDIHSKKYLVILRIVVQNLERERMCVRLVTVSSRNRRWYLSKSRMCWTWTP